MSRAADRPLLVFYGHHKGATGWIDGVLRETCFHLGWRFRIVHRPVDWAQHGSIRGYVDAERPDLFAYTNADLAHAQTLPLHRAFHVVRDPRDVLVSAYFSHIGTHPTDGWPELEAHRERLQAVSKEEGLMLEMVFSRPTFEEFAQWDYAQPHVLELKMEEVTAHPHESFTRIYEHFGILDHEPKSPLADTLDAARRQLNALNQRGRHKTPFALPIQPLRLPMQMLSERGLDAVLERKSFKRMAGGRAKGQEDRSSHYRKGKAGDWQNHFTPALAARFAEEYGTLLVRLGYAADDRWVESIKEPIPAAA